MFAWLGSFTYRRRRFVLATAAAFVAVAVVWGTGVFGQLSGGGFEDPNAESARATAAADAALGRDDADVIALYRSADLTVDDPAFRSAVEGVLDRLPEEAVTGVTTYWETNAPPLASTDRRATYVVVQLAGADEDARSESYEEVKDSFAAPGLDVQLGGTVTVGEEINTQVSEDIKRAEIISMPVLLVLLVVIFGGLVAASLPLAIGGVAILGAFTMLRLLTTVSDVSIFAINIVTFLGLGLAIDYALFIVSRFREELRRDGQVDKALVRTMQTAGRTVAFSGVTVAVSLASLLFFPQNFLRSMGFGGMAAVLVAMVAALTVLPALLAVLGHRVDALRLPMPFRGRRAARAASTGNSDHGAWYRIAHAVMRRPLVFIGVTVVVLLALGAPFLRIAFGGVDARVLPEGTPSRMVSEALQRDFVGAATSPVEVVVNGADRAAVGSYVAALQDVPGVTGAAVTGAAGDTTRISLGYTGEANDDATQDIVQAVRDVPAPAGADVLVGGETAMLVDLLDGLGNTLPWMALFVVAVTGVLLFFAFGSVVLPVKAVVMNALSLAATFGVIVWIFQDGNLSGVLGFTATGSIEATQPILILALAFGLSMDYEVFLLSRIREQWDRTGDNTQAVATGLQRSGQIITSAALLLIVVIGAFSTSGITFIKMIGLGMVVAIVIDATIVRALLVPATMRLLGRANWYAPKPLLRIYDRFGFSETEEIALDEDGAKVPDRVLV